MVRDKTVKDVVGSLAASRLIRACRDLLLLRVSKDRLRAVSCDAVEGTGSKLRSGALLRLLGKMAASSRP